MRSTTIWVGTLHAVSSIAHDGERRGTVSLLRRERFVSPDGEFVHVPVVSGNALRGALRRTACDLFVDALELEGELSLPAAQLLRGGGGALHKSSKAPLTGARLARLRQLVPPVAVFGGTVGSRTLSGALQVGKVVPHLVETAHLITPTPAADIVSTSSSTTSLPDVFTATQLETYTRVEDTEAVLSVSAVPVRPDGSLEARTVLEDAPAAAGATGQMLYRIETFPAGTRFDAWLQLLRADPIVSDFTHEAVHTFTAGGRLGGRRGIGHGRFTADWTITAIPAIDGEDGVRWREQLLGHRQEILDLLATLP